jgi:hypothetical protein
MTDSADAPAPVTGGKPTRNPVERLVVWGLIAALLIVTGLEGQARLSYSRTLGNLQGALTAAELQSESTFLIDQVPGLIVGSPAVSHESRRFDQLAHYQWKGLFRQYGLHVSYGTYTKIVTGVTSDDPPADPVAEKLARAVEEAGESVEATGDSDRGGERPRFDPMQADADGDGRLSPEEAPGRMGEMFATIDKNGDGFLDAAEIEARPRRGFGGSRPGDGSGGESGSAPRTDRANARPPLDVAPAEPTGPANSSTAVPATSAAPTE